ncbi:hypothetical protein NP233_g8095 [Leucocoprinus birnbaumii]|uniref:Uncharacterized protein n=1 Tax=Leucocoprinus birnbaumii TaxID=56174 RepID=A0AAD5VN26_9AGAR|nr:hypothetical protein NP233_g8095 [Leucocoprinus birnbaumii]
MTDPVTLFVPPSIDVDPYFGHQVISLAISKFIKSTSTIPSPTSTTSTPLDLRIAQIIHECQVPNIVPYSALYLLASISRTCTCGKNVSDDELLDAYDDLEDSRIVRRPSFLSHRLSQMKTRSPLSRVRQSHWDGYLLFIGTLFVSLRVHRPTFALGILAEITEIVPDELESLHAAIFVCMDEDLKLALGWMIKESEFRSLNDVECPVVVVRRKRAAYRKPDRRTDHAPLRRLFSRKSSKVRHWKSTEDAIQDYEGDISGRGYTNAVTGSTPLEVQRFNVRQSGGSFRESTRRHNPRCNPQLLHPPLHKMTYTILGRAIRNEHLALGVLLTAFGGGYAASRGGKSESKPIPQSVKEAKASVPIAAGSNDEEEFIKKFIEEAEKENKH